MERLIADAAKLDSSVQANDMSFGNMVKAIHAVQTELGIAGATALEAATTIEGSVNAMKAAWSNLVTGFADENANLETLITNFFESVTAVGQNVIPRVGQALEGIVNAILISVDTLIPQMMDSLTNNMPAVVGKGAELISKLIVGLVKATPQLIAKMPELIFSLILALGSAMEPMTMAGIDLITWLITGIDSMITSVVHKVESIMLEIGSAIKAEVNKAKEWGRDLIQNFIDGIKSKISALTSSIKNVAQTVRSYIHFTKPDVGPLSDFDTYAPDMIELFTEGLDKNAYKIGESFNKSLDFGVETVPFAQSSYGVASSATLNAMASATPSESPVNGVIRLVTPDGKNLMEWAFNDLVSVAKSRGTPLLAT